MKFSAVILAGGKSSRMGRDKAWLEIEGGSLIARQVELARELEPVELFVSARPSDALERLNCPVLADAYVDQGPLAGMEAALVTMNSPLLLVLAVDMPRMRLDTLRWLLAGCEAGRGAVPCAGELIEPLAAVYPKSAHGLAVEALKSGRNSARGFAKLCATSGCVRFVDIEQERLRDFTNCNSPAEWSSELTHD